jgi:hypothetical protein
MPLVRFPWNPVLVDLRRAICPRARWQKQTRCWVMTEDEADAFKQAAHAALNYQKWQTEIAIDEVTWVTGFAQGAPYRLPSEQVA